MITKDFRIGFLGRNLFDKEKIKLFQEEWSKLSDSEKLKLMNKQVESMGHESFSVKTINSFCEEWWSKSSEEKQAFVDEWEQTIENKIPLRQCFGGSRFGSWQHVILLNEMKKHSV